MKNVLPVDASMEDIEVDETLSFLNAFVNDAVSKGGKRYIPSNDSDEDSDDESKKKTAINVVPYELPPDPATMIYEPKTSGI
jgi:AP-4 complex subunit epsilon-1